MKMNTNNNNNTSDKTSRATLKIEKRKLKILNCQEWNEEGRRIRMSMYGWKWGMNYSFVTVESHALYCIVLRKGRMNVMYYLNFYCLHPHRNY